MTRPRQLPLDLAHGDARTRDDLVVTPANEAAVNLIESWPAWPARLVVLCGPAGAGKSHLAEIWRQDSGARKIGTAYLDETAMSAVERGPVVVDDADRPDIDEHGLFHLINASRQAGSHLLLTARRRPAGWGVRLPDLMSRLKAAAVVELSAPDDGLLAGVIVKLFADRQVEIEPHVVHYLVRRMERSLAAARAVVTRLDAAALERKCRVTRALAGEVLAEPDAAVKPAD